MAQHPNPYAPPQAAVADIGTEAWRPLRLTAAIYCLITGLFSVLVTCPRLLDWMMWGYITGPAFLIAVLIAGLSAGLGICLFQRSRRSLVMALILCGLSLLRQAAPALRLYPAIGSEVASWLDLWIVVAITAYIIWLHRHAALR